MQGHDFLDITQHFTAHFFTWHTKSDYMRLDTGVWLTELALHLPACARLFSQEWYGNHSGVGDTTTNLGHSSFSFMLWDFYGWITGKAVLKKESCSRKYFGCMYKVHRLKGRTPKQQKKQSLLSLHKKNSTKREPMLLHKKELHFSHTCWDKTSKILRCLTASGVHAGQVPECHCTSEPNTPTLRETAFSSNPLNFRGTLHPAGGSLGFSEPKCSWLLKGEHCLLTTAQCSTLFYRNGKKYHCVGS